MKVQELFEEELEDYIKRLTTKELMKRLGNGSYGTVFQHPVYHNVVVKVFDGFDDGYRDWLQFVKRNQKNAYVPQIISVHMVENEHGDEIGICFMKKLRKAPISKIKELVKKVNALCGKNKLVSHNYKFSHLSSGDWEKIAAGSAKDDPSLSKVARLFAQNRPDDLHDANIMMDENDHLIFTDPLAY